MIGWGARIAMPASGVDSAGAMYALTPHGTSYGSGTAHGGATNVPANSIATYLLDPVTGQVSGPSDVKPVNGNPVSVLVHPTVKFVYVVNEVRFGGTIGNISAFSVDSTTGALTAIGTVADLGGVPATALAFAPSGEFAYVTYAPPDPQLHNNFDTVKTFGVGGDGLFTSSPIGSAPTGDSPWAIVVTPGGHFAYVASLSIQANVDQLATYAIDQTSETLSLQSSVGISQVNGQSPLALAMDPEARFVYVGLQSDVFAPPSSNFNVQVYGIASSGSLSFRSGADTGNNPQGPIAIVAEPQAEFVYVMDANGQLETFSIGNNGVLTTSGNPMTGLFIGGNTGGVGDPFFFAASGTSPEWLDNCTVLIDNSFPYDGCLGIALSAGPGSSGRLGGNGTPPPPPPATFVLQVLVDVTGGSVVSTPPGIDNNAVAGTDFFNHAFAANSSITLTASPPDILNKYDVKWTGDCSGTTVTVTVGMSADRHCFVTFTQPPP